MVPKEKTVSWLLLILSCACTLAACTGSREHARLLFSRYSDSVRVELDPQHSAHWSPADDSVVVECTECYQNKDRVTLRFQDRNNAYLSTDASPSMKFSVYHRQMLDTTYTLDAEDLLDKEPVAGAVAPRHQTTPSHHEAKKATTDTKVVTTKKATMLKVTANEGVAVYKDKSKREVLRILPKGATLPYLAKEGDMYSVVLDEVEGFVDADAVQIAP